MFMVSAVTMSSICLSSRATRSASAAPGLLMATEAMNRWMAVSTPSSSVVMMSLSLPSTHSSICSARSVEDTSQMVLPWRRRPAQV